MKYCLVILTAFVLVSCSLKDETVNPAGGNRNYYLGFTPYPYDVTTEAQDYVYNKISKDADIINHHFDDGIPWNEALYNQSFNSNITNDWAYRKAKTPAGHKVIVSITPINTSRDGLALYKGAQPNMTLPAPWNGYNFNNPYVEEAYINYCRRVIDYFNPDYLVIGIEH